MTDNNVTISTVEGRPSILIFETQSGEILHCTPMSLPTLRAIHLKAADLFPYPNPEPYRIPDPEDVAFTPGQQSSRAEDNPEYVAKCQQVDVERNKWANRAVFDYAVKFPKYPTKEDLIEAYREKLEALRAISKIDDDDYDTILFFIVLSWNVVAENSSGNLVVASNEYGRVISLITQKVALSAAEVANGIRFFRPRVQ